MWMDLEDVTLNRVRQSLKNKYGLIPLMASPSQTPEVKQWLPRAARGNGGLTLEWG